MIPHGANPEFPIAVRYIVSEDIATEAESAMKDVFMPVWLQVALPLVVGLQVMINLPKLLESGVSTTGLKVLALIAGFYAFMFWRSARNKRLARAAIVGKEVAVRFQTDAFDYSIGQKAESLSYSNIVRAGRDERGLVLIIEKLGGLWIPTQAFSSPDQRDFIFSYLGRFLKKR